MNRQDEDITLCERLEELLPHGSGINGDWNIERKKNGRFYAANFFQAMDEMGGYCHNYDFTAVIDLDLDKFTLDKINFHSQRERSCCGYDLKSYLEEDIYQVLDYKQKGK